MPKRPVNDRLARCQRVEVARQDPTQYRAQYEYLRRADAREVGPCNLLQVWPQPPEHDVIRPELDNLTCKVVRGPALDDPGRTAGHMLQADVGEAIEVRSFSPVNNHPVEIPSATSVQPSRIARLGQSLG